VLKSRWLRYLAIGAAVILVISAILRILTPPTKPIPQTKLESTHVIKDLRTIFQGVEYVGDDIEVPKTFSIARVTSETLKADAVRDQIISEYNLKKQGTTGNLWAGNTYSFSYDPSSQQYALTSNFFPDFSASSAGTLSKEQAVRVATGFIEKYLQSSSKTETKPELLQFYSGDADLERSSEQEASWIMVPFSYFIDGYPVLFKNVPALPFSVLIDKDYRVKRFDFFPFFINYTVFQKSKSLSVEQAIKNINNQKASVTSISNQQEGPLDLENIRSGKMRGGYIEYHYDESSKLIYPFYHFVGELTDAANRKYTVDVITPAIETTPQL
jgi:hypothetical protein